MAEAPKPEDSLNAPQQEKKEEKKPVGTLESVVNEVGSLLKTTGGAALAVGMPLALGQIAPPVQRDAFVVGTAFSAGKMYENYKAEKKTRISDIVKESAVGTLLAAPIHYSYNLMNLIGNPILKAAAYLGPYTLGVIPLYLGIDHLVKKGFKGIYSEGIKPHVKRVVRDNYLYLGVAGLLNLFFTPLYLQVPVALGLGFLFKIIAGKNNEKAPESDKRDKTPYYVAAPRALGRGLKSIFYGVPEAVYSVSSALGEKLSYKAAPKPAAPAPAAQPV